MSNVKKFHSFRELILTVSKENRPDLFRFSKDGKMVLMSGKEWADRIWEKEKEFARQGYSSVAIIQAKSPEMAANFMAAVLAGKRVLLIDPMESIDKMAVMISHCNIEEVIIDASFEEEEIAFLKNVLKPSLSCDEKGEGDILFFTSGTSGIPKACVLTSASLLSSSFNGQSCLPCGEQDIILSLIPLSHVFGFVCTFLWPLCYHASIAFGSGMKTMAQDVIFFKPTILPVIPSLAGFLLMNKAINPELTTILVGAGPLSLSMIQAFQALGKRVAFGYGLTETSSGVAISVGAKDPFAMTPCPEDTFRQEADGTISIHSSCLMKGYYNNPKATEEAVHDGWLKTSDRGYLDADGNLHILGRVDDIAVLANGTKFDCNIGEQKLVSYIGGLYDLALTVREGKLAMIVHLPRPEAKPIVEKAVQGFNADSDLYSKISRVEYSETPLPRTKTGKIIRYQLAQKGE
jgi:long-subunit acyl-CoA synthetase (AMP-forming)